MVTYERSAIFIMVVNAGTTQATQSISPYPWVDGYVFVNIKTIFPGPGIDYAFATHLMK